MSIDRNATDTRNVEKCKAGKYYCIPACPEQTERVNDFLRTKRPYPREEDK